MASKGIAAFSAIVCLCTLVWVGGCTGIGFGEVTYSEGQLLVMVDNPSEPVEATLQVTIFRTGDFKQTEVANIVEGETIQTGQTSYTFPVDLEPGVYKLYLYITKGNARTVSVIRDIRV
ncbi:MAG: hypothetical protein PWP08_1190 [Methanofollis sp.]|nr:hypothetical protein [Methanofollis sp.]